MRIAVFGTGGVGGCATGQVSGLEALAQAHGCKMIEKQGGVQYPVLPLRDIVVFPHMVVPLFVGREKSVRALEDVMKDDKQILLVTQKNAAQDDPSTSDIYTIDTIGTVLQLLKHRADRTDRIDVGRR